MQIPINPAQTTSPVAFTEALLAGAQTAGRPFEAAARRMFVMATRGDELQWSGDEAKSRDRMRYAHRLFSRAVIAAISEGRCEVSTAMVATAIADEG